MWTGTYLSRGEAPDFTGGLEPYSACCFYIHSLIVFLCAVLWSWTDVPDLSQGQLISLDFKK
jgi:hypothetical protein